MSDYKLKKLKVFHHDGREAYFIFTGSNGKSRNSEYEKLANLEYIKETFIKNICYNCFEHLNDNDFIDGNYDMWISAEQSFLNVDKFNPDNLTKLEVAFHINKLTHKNCQAKKEKSSSSYDYGENKMDIQTFLKDKEYWVEELSTDWVLFVKNKGKIYKSSVSKKRAKMFEEYQNVKQAIVKLALSDIKLQITKDENIDRMIIVERLKKHFNKKNDKRNGS